MEHKPRTKRRRNLEPGTARTRSQQVKVSETDRELIVALAQLDGLTPSSWCYQAIMRTVESQRHRLRNANLRLVRSGAEPEASAADAPEPAPAASRVESGERPAPLAYSEA